MKTALCIDNQICLLLTPVYPSGYQILSCLSLLALITVYTHLVSRSKQKYFLTVPAYPWCVTMHARLTSERLYLSPSVLSE